MSKQITSSVAFGVTDEDLKKALNEIGPVVVAMDASTISMYSSGVFSGCSVKPAINHAVLLVGFTAEGHWVIKNSWGTSWGDQGYMTIHKDRDCGLKYYVTLPVFAMHKKKVIIIVCSVVGSVVLIAGIAIAVYFIRKKQLQGNGVIPQ